MSEPKVVWMLARVGFPYSSSYLLARRGGNTIKLEDAAQFNSSNEAQVEAQKEAQRITYLGKIVFYYIATPFTVATSPVFQQLAIETTPIKGRSTLKPRCSHCGTRVAKDSGSLICSCCQ